MPSGLKLRRNSGGEPIWAGADVTRRASDEETCGDGGRCTKSGNFCRKAAFGNVELIAKAARERPNACRMPDRAPPTGTTD